MSPQQPAPTLYLVRHGRTALNVGGRLRGRLDPPLDQEGQNQAHALGQGFAALPRPPRRVVAGPLLRTRQTAAAIGRALDVEVLVDDRLVDRDYGPWTGQPGDEVRARFGQALVDLPDAEPVDAMVARARAALDAQLPSLVEPVVLVAHDAVNSHLLAALDPSLGTAADIRQDTACWNRLERVEDGWWVAVLNGSPDRLGAG
jgi:probable phosphoglycerate mutase